MAGKGGGGSAAGGISVASFFGLLGLKVDKASWAEGNKQIDSMRTAVLGLGAYFGGAALGKALISYNANLEDARNQIAGMFALSKHTNYEEEIAGADRMVESLRKRAASLPGTTAEYVQMLSMLAGPLTSAKLGMQDIEDITVNSVVGAKAMGVAWDAAARDVDQALRGQFHSTDVFTGKILASVGYVGEAGRAKFNAMSEAARAAALKGALTQKQLTQLAEAQGKSFRGVWATFTDAVEQFLGKVGLPLFKALGEAISAANAYLEAHADDLAAIADVIGSVLAAAFGALGEVFAFLTSGTAEAQAVLIGIAAAIAAIVLPALASMAIGWAAALWPILLIGAAVAAVVMFIKKAGPTIVGVFKLAWGWVADKARWLADKVREGFELIRDIAVAVGSAIKSAFKTALDWIEGKIQWLIDKYNWIKAKLDEASTQTLNKLGVAKEDQSTGVKAAALVAGAAVTFSANWFSSDEPAVPTATAGPSATSSNVTDNRSVNANITINDASDPKAVGAEVRKQLTDQWNTIAQNRGLTP